ncbi:hypothetical protein NP233_g3003 [Leucocoprinus birnbaumii]|uniref:Zf-C3HC-domain-containing protein n=1 Tax=Leucocoprinus birnbaumii TaxID=56174 RepID=A0AAD5VXU6_9AGAR|nr:hypothetical protein NP233_g3003 [Leucocoprinus birnbaumii]
MDSSPVAEAQDQFRATKRKLDDAFFELDNSVIAPELVEQPRPLKRTNTSRSIYSTLTKYGISTKSTASSPSVTPGLTKPTPHLSAILARATTRTKSLLSLNSSKNSHSSDLTLSSSAEYRPSSIASFLSRLSTFKLATYANKPPQIDAVAASKCGWTNDGKDRLVCGVCGASWVVAGRDGMSRDAANALVEKQRLSLVEAHKRGCPWKTRQCDPSIYRIPLQSPAATVRNIKTVAISLSEPLKDVKTKHPLTQAQVNSVKAIILAYSMPTNAEEATGQLQDPEPPSEPAVLAALFGWSIVPPTSKQESRKTSFSRSGTPIPGTPARSPSISRASTPARGTPLKFNLPSTVPNKRDTLLHCALCQRRIGLWTFLAQTTTVKPTTNGTANETPITTPKKTVQQRDFDLLREHRSYCPYVVRSTVIPAIPIPPSISDSTTNISQPRLTQSNSDGVEGWRAVTTMVLRYGLGQRYMSDHDIFTPEGNSSRESEDAGETDGVKAMVAGVKSKGGKDLLKYVRGLLN